MVDSSSQEDTTTTTSLWDLITKLNYSDSSSFWEVLISILRWNQYLILKFYYVIFFIAYLYRFFKHKSDGIISRKESKPVSFKCKFMLQVLMILTTLAMCV